ncbi:MAG: NADH-quinone oxidoreductase subunit C [Planctomycetes bacterium]|nr:NADH-quinone oxidoreductase subunit C [Planctomycetota bacterium]
MKQQGFVPVRAGQAIPQSRLALMPGDVFRRVIVDSVEAGQRVAALFATPLPGGAGEDAVFEMYAALADSARAMVRIGRTRIEGDRVASLTSACPQAHLFEREIAEQLGIVFEGHPWMKPVRFHGSYRPGRDAWGRTAAPVVGVMDYYRVEGDEIHEVAVGPVHAGIIEPGHFRFQCHGEQVFHLEISLGYQHRGAERTLTGGPTKRTIHTMETLAGDTTIGHALAYCQAVESLSAASVPIRADVLRGIALELERLANHTGDLGALANDIGFLPTASYCGRLRGDFLNLTALLCGSRFGRGLVRPGGVRFDLDEPRKQECLERLDAAFRDVDNAVSLLWTSASVQARFEETGAVDQDVARSLGLVGPAARACGIECDVRHDFPTGIFRFTQVPMSTWMTGDVFARAFVRWMEIQRSVAFIREQLEALPDGPVQAGVLPMKPEHLAVSLVEGWRGEICHIALTDANGRFARYKVVDPSFHNWMGLAMALRDQQISDFPLCNKSFNLSYCGHDL